MRLFRMICDYDHCLDLGKYLGRDDLANAMLRDESLAQHWIPLEAQRRAGGCDTQSDFVKTCWNYAEFGVNARAAELLRPHVADCCEFLPFTHKGEHYWVLYVRKTSDCLDYQRSIFHSDDKEPRHVFVPFFLANKIPSWPLIRFPRDGHYYIKQELKDRVEQAGLTGVKFQFMWSDDGWEPELEEDPHLHHKKPQRKRRKRPVSLDDPRAQLLQRLWDTIILPRGNIDQLDRRLAVSRFLASERYSSARVIRRLVRNGVPKVDLLELMLAVAYEVTFEVLQAIEEECLDKSPGLQSLHEDLLIAEPD